MSDLNDLIATNAINSFNSGLQTGIAQERHRIVELLEKAMGSHNHAEKLTVLLADLKGKQK